MKTLNFLPMKKLLAVIAVCALSVTTIFGQTANDIELSEKLQARVDIDVNNRLLLETVNEISRDVGIRINNRNLINPVYRVRSFSGHAAYEEVLQLLLDRDDLTFIPQQDGSISLEEIRTSSTVYGNVFNRDNSEPVGYADVFLENTLRGSATDEEGYFSIRNIPEGIYNLRIQFIGYKPQSIRLNLQRGKMVALNIFLEIDVLQMEQVEVVGEANNEVIYKPRISSFTFKPRQLELQPSYGDQDIMRSLQVLPGVTATSEYKSQLYIRGGNSDQNLVLLNGGILYNPFHFSGIMSAFDTDALESADIYLGGFSAEYGGRLSSVLDIKTRRGKDDMSGQLNLSPISSKLLFEFPDEQRWSSFLLSLRRSNVNAFSQKLGGRVEPDFYDLILSHDLHPPGRMKIVLTGFLSEDKVNLQEGENTNPITSDNKLAIMRTELRASQTITLLSDLSLGQFNSSLPPSQGVGKSTNNRLTDGSATLKMNWQLQSNLGLTAGIDYRIIQAKYESPDQLVSKLSSSEKSFDRALYVQGRYQWHEKWDIETGIRFQSYRIDQPTLVEPRVSVRYRFSNALSVKGNYGRFSQNLVTVYNENDTYNPVDIWLSPTSSLEYATADHLILGMDYQSAAMNLTVETYLKQYYNLTHYNRERLSEDDPFFIQGEGLSYGLDMSFQYVSDWWQVLTTYSLGKATKTLPFQYPEPHTTTFSPRYDQRHSFNLNLSLTPNDKWEISTRFTLGSGLPFTFITGYYVRIPGQSFNPTSEYIAGENPGSGSYMVGLKSDINAFRYPTYHRLDLSVRYKFEWNRYQVEPYVSLLNVYDQNNVLYYNALGEPQWSLPFLPMIGVDMGF